MGKLVISVKINPNLYIRGKTLQITAAFAGLMVSAVDATLQPYTSTRTPYVQLRLLIDSPD